MNPKDTFLSPVVAACIKWVDLRPELDSVQGTLAPSRRGGGFSAADLSAAETALRIAEAWSGTAVLVCAGPANADRSLLEVAASGFSRTVRVDIPGQLETATVAELLVRTLGQTDLDVDLVVCGDMSYDRSSGAVPAMLAHHLDFCQALGLLSVEPVSAEPADDHTIVAIRRLDGARRERIRIPIPAVISVEGGIATLRRAALDASMGESAHTDAEVEVRGGHSHGESDPPRTTPWRPRARTLAGPGGESAFDRILELTGSLSDTSPPRTVKADPSEAARMIMDSLAEWGYLGSDD